MARKTETVTCYKCDGHGSLAHYGHIANGKCFACWGAGTIEVDYMAPNEKLDCLRGSLRYSADIVLDAAYHDNDERAVYYLKGMLDDMFRVGTRRAREVLDYLGAGRFWDDDDQRFYTVNRARARELRAELIKLGCERKAAA
jgi:hypothetical protein